MLILINKILFTASCILQVTLYKIHGRYYIESGSVFFFFFFLDCVKFNCYQQQQLENRSTYKGKIRKEKLQ